MNTVKNKTKKAFDYGLIQFVLLFTCIYIFGFLLGIVSLIAVVALIDFLLGKVGYRRLTSLDLLITIEKDERYNHISGYLEIEKITFKEFKDTFVNKAIRNIPKLTQAPVRHFGFTLWKNLGIKSGEAQITELKRKFQNQDEIVAYLNEIAGTKFTTDKPLWEIKVVENYTDDTSIIILKTHHCLTDGMGMLWLLSLLNDEEFKIKAERKFPEPSFLVNLLMSFIFPIIIVAKAPFGKSFVTDENARKIQEIEGKDVPTYKFFASESFEFEQVRKCYKKYPDTTFNDYLLSMVSKSLSQWYLANNIERAEKIIMTMAVSTRGLPTQISEIDLDNNLCGLKFLLPICSDLDKGIKLIKPVVRQYLTYTFVLAYKKFVQVIRYLPRVLVENIIDDLSKGTDFSYSNVPFPNTPIYIWNKKIQQITAFASPVIGTAAFFVANTYLGKLRLSFVSKENLKMNPKQFLDLISKNFREEIAKFN